MYVPLSASHVIFVLKPVRIKQNLTIHLTLRAARRTKKSRKNAAQCIQHEFASWFPNWFYYLSEMIISAWSSLIFFEEFTCNILLEILYFYNKS